MAGGVVLDRRADLLDGRAEANHDDLSRHAGGRLDDLAVLQKNLDGRDFLRRSCIGVGSRGSRAGLESGGGDSIVINSGRSDCNRDTVGPPSELDRSNPTAKRLTSIAQGRGHTLGWLTALRLCCTLSG